MDPRVDGRLDPLRLAHLLKRKLVDSTSTPRAKRQMTAIVGPSSLVDPVTASPSLVNEEIAFLSLNLFSGNNVLHLGCREGDLTLTICNDVKPGHVVGIDYSQADIRKATANAAYQGVENVTFRVVQDMRTLPFEDDLFDAVFASNLEMRRVTKPGGIVATRDVAAHHFFPNKDLDNLLTRNMFKAAGLTHGWYGPLMPKLFKHIGFDLHSDELYVTASASCSWGRARWIAAGIPESTINLCLKKLESWGKKDTAWYVCVYAEVLAHKDSESLEDTGMIGHSVM
ncbi:S-adenosyl-L-methionine-dependent methyltransferase [Xylariaceae sp. FL1651]|nr:S-adenosyl-L-methionine-dependent methyltransferase [Xylariaceae sp. FL1651]